MANRYHIIKRVTIIGAITNAILVITKITFGLLGNSSALFTDGIHSLSDTFSDLFILMCAFFANKEKDDNHPYGHQRIETAATVFLSLLLILAGAGLAYHAYISFIITNSYPHKYTIIVAIASVVLNEWLYKYTFKAGKKINSDLLIANAWHNRSDSLSSLIVLIGIIGALAGYPIMDSIAAIIVSIIIIKIGIKWGLKAILELIDTAAEPNIIQNINIIIKNTPGVISLHNLRTRMMAGNIILDVHILVDANITASEGHYIGELIRANVANQIKNIQDITIHIDTESHNEDIPEYSQLPVSKAEILKDIEPLLKKEGIKKYLSDCQITYQNAKIELSIYLNIKILDIKTTEQIQLAMRRTYKASTYDFLIKVFYQQP
jgi:cation diffusion facilitator family transporter